jgi:tetratricopeptide (TPR) repeat protein
MGTSLTVVGGANILAALNFLDGDREAAFKGIRATQDEALRLGLPWIASHAAAVGAWLEFQSGDLSAVEIWARNNYLPSAMESNPMYTVEQLVYIRLLIARGEYQAALEMLERMRVQAEEGERFQLLSEIEILLALAQDGSGNQAAALESFDRAARRSAPEDGYRIFLNDDTTGLVKKLIASLPKAEDDLLRAFLNQVLVDSGLGAGSTSHSARTASPSGARYHPAPLRAREARGGTGSTKQPAELVEAITPRELDVLQLMAEGPVPDGQHPQGAYQLDLRQAGCAQPAAGGQPRAGFRDHITRSELTLSLDALNPGGVLSCFQYHQNQAD